MSLSSIAKQGNFFYHVPHVLDANDPTPRASRSTASCTVSHVPAGHAKRLTTVSISSSRNT